MKKRWKWGMASISCLLVIIIISRLFISDKAYASELPPIAISYSSSDSAATNGWQGVYSSQSTLKTDTLNIDVGAGNIIDKAELKRDGVTVATIDAAKDKQTWSGQVDLNGDAHMVTSIGNMKVAGYYAWYRYMPTDPHGVLWYEEGGSSPPSPADIYSVETENVLGFDMPKYPGVMDDSLHIQGARDQPYKLDGSELPSTVVGSPLNMAIKTNDYDEIYGPEYLKSKTDLTTTIDVNKSEQASTPDNMVVYYSQTFDHEGAVKQLGLPGAKLMAYFAAFSVDIQATTYKYPDQLIVTYKPAVGSPPPTPSATPTPNNGPEVVTGDFTLDKTVINFGDSNAANPVNVKVSGGNGSKLVEFGYTFTQNNLVWSTVGPTSIASAQSFTGPPYPKGMGGGNVDVTMTIKTSLGTVKTVGPKSFTILIPPNNNPPVFKGAWFQGGNSNSFPPITQVLLGQYVDLGIVHDPTEDPKTPYDPEGDDIIYTWDFAGSSDPWIQAIGDRAGGWNHDEHYSLVKADVLGIHTVKVSAIDRRGASGGTQDVTIQVMDPNAPPVPVITLPPKVVEGRTFTPDISGQYSYSPIIGRTIASYIWSGKQSMYPTTGTYPITLSVVDSAGIQSEYPATADLIVQPDLPPIPQLDNPGIGIRNSPIYFKDTSYSPDGDPIAVHTTELAYDSNNDGSFADEAYSPVTLDANGNFNYTAAKVGKYDIRIYLKEGLGYKRDATGHFGFEIVNDAPEADYYVEGSDYAPPLVETSSFSASTLLNDANWKTSTPSNDAVTKKYLYNSSENALETPKGQSVPYKSLTSSNLTVTNKDWSGSSSYYNHDGPLMGGMITPDLFNNGASTFTNINFTYPGNFLPFPLSIPNYVYSPMIKELDVENDKVWFYADNISTSLPYDSDKIFQDWVFRISDITREALEGWRSTYKAQPIYQRTTTYKYPNNGSNVSDPPMPSNVWTHVPEKKTLGISVNAGVGMPYQIIEYGNKVTNGTNNYFKSPYLSDRQGNTYRWYGDINSGNNIYLQKLSPTGNVIWSYLYESLLDWYSVESKIPNFPSSITYISEDNNTIVISDTNSYDTDRDSGSTGGYIVLNNTTGIPIYQSDAETTNHKLYNDKIISFTTPMEPRTTSNYQPFSQYIHYFDLKTNTLNSVKLFTYELYDNPNKSGIPVPPSPRFLVSSDGKVSVFNKDRLIVLDMQGNVISSVDGLIQRGSYSGMFYNGDGSLVISTSDSYSGGTTADYLYIIKSDPDPTAKLNSFGQLSNPGVSLTDGDVTAQIKLNYDNFTDTVSTGVSARIQNNQNMYRLEVTAKKTRIVKMVNGVKTVLAEANYPLQFRQWYDLKLKVRGSNLKGYIGGVPVVEANDSTFSSGLAGPYSEVEYALLKGFSVTKYLSNAGVTRNTAIVGTTMNYFKSYSDTENDPTIDPLTKWTYTHTNPNKFLDAGDGYSGLSAYNGQTVTAPKPVLDKVGEYKVDYQVPDDPAPAGYKFPNDTFSGYRKYSNVASHTIIIHRRPIAVFSLYLNGDNTVGWNDTSYDPDRWLSPWNYSTEPTGINYQANRGIVGRKMNFTTPSGETRSGQLIKPGESGTYTVRLAVQDEYGAWSDWAETTINITIPFPNNKPSATLTFPSGTQANPTYVSLQPTLTWIQSDPDPNTIFTQFEVLVKDEYGNTYESKTSSYYTNSPTWGWTLDNTLDPGKKYYAQVRVWDDGGLVSDWSNIGWMVTNAPPTASMADPNGTQASPTIFTTTKPTFTWNQTDPDAGNIFTQAEIQVTNEANTVTLYDKVIPQWTSQTWKSFQADQDLPAGQKLRVRVRVWDNQGAASNWSAQTWFMINRPPVADFDWSPKPVWEGDTVQLTNLSIDPDGDSLSFLWEVTGPDGQSASYDTTNVTQKFLLAGEYKVKLTVSDGCVSSQAIKVITAQPLTIVSDVEHTPEWLANHQKLQHNTTVRPIDFYSGEIFVVHTRSSPAPVSRAEAWLDTTGLDGNELKINTLLAQSVDDSTLFQGQLFDERLLSVTEGLPKGIQTIHFRMQYANGVIKEEDVPVMIIGNVWEFVQVHRVK